VLGTRPGLCREAGPGRYSCGGIRSAAVNRVTEWARRGRGGSRGWVPFPFLWGVGCGWGKGVVNVSRGLVRYKEGR